jgi:hypothetical protein
MESRMRHTIAILKLPRRTGDVILFAQSVSSAMKDNPFFSSPNPPLATLDLAIADVAAAEALVLTRAKGLKEARDAKLEVLLSDLESERAYVQQVANANPSEASGIIESAGMHVRRFTMRATGGLLVTRGRVSGTARLVAQSAGDRARYDWQFGRDETTWTSAPGTMQCKTDISGLVPGLVYFFRVRPTTIAGRGAWSQIVSLLIA